MTKKEKKLIDNGTGKSKPMPWSWSKTWGQWGRPGRPSYEEFENQRDEVLLSLTWTVVEFRLGLGSELHGKWGRYKQANRDAMADVHLVVGNHSSYFNSMYRNSFFAMGKTLPQYPCYTP